MRWDSFNLKEEFAAAQTVAQRLEGDLITRVVASILTTAIIAWSGLPWLALIWIGCVFLNEAIEPTVVRQMLKSNRVSARKLFLYTSQLTSGSAIWAAAGLALWMTRDPAIMTLGAVLVLGTLMHVTLIYSVSRLIVSAVAAPLVIAMCIMAALVIADEGVPFRDKFIVILAVVILLGYLTSLLITNIATQDELTKLARQNAEQARKDTLTGLSNRRHFIEEIKRLELEEIDWVLAFIDLDRFKPLNDEHGHAIGDEALKAVAARLKSMEAVSLAARLGGDEFGVLLLHRDDHDSLDEILQKIWDSVTTPIETSIGSVHLGASVGCVKPRSILSGHSKLLHAADVAMLRAKASGGGTAIFDPSIDASMLESAEIESALRDAVANGRIKAALQPIKSTRTQTIKKFELLARWSPDGRRSTLSPAEFIPLAERLGLLNDLLWNTLDQALPQIRGTDRTLAINISPSQLLSTQFLSKLDSILRQHVVPANQIELEITEQIALRNEAENLAILSQAREMGFSVVLDDFGTGYSSVSLLEKLPLSKVKLDHTFVRDSFETPHGRKLLTAIIGLLKQMNLACCVEGVETVEIEQFVAELGCEEVQGYLIGKPQIIDCSAQTVQKPSESHASKPHVA